MPGYPHPSPAWIDEWHRLLDIYQLQPTNVSSWVDTQMWKDRDLTLDEAVAQLTLDMRLSALLGFAFIRPKFGVISPELNPHPLWRETVLRVLDLAHELKLVICPEIHSPTPIRHRVTETYIKFIDETKTENFRLMIDTGIFQTVASDEHHLGFEKGGKRPAFLEPLKVPMADLTAIMPYVGFVQSKFFEITDDLETATCPGAAF